MSVRLLSLHLVLFSVIILAAGCGSSSSSTKSSKKETPAAKTEPAPAPVTPPAATPPPAKAEPPVALKAVDPKPADTKATPPKAGDAKPAEAGKRLQAEGASDFTQAYMKGKKIEDWITLLDSKNKDEVIEAIQVCQLAKSKKAIEKLNELTKNADKEIADDAKFAIGRINAPN
ncbi:MAG TPA: hypothetical protein VEJ63_07495 [Planctomycetota bacterium]|nr:hypothetical protein [Planctomycetota bacterium]